MQIHYSFVPQHCCSECTITFIASTVMFSITDGKLFDNDLIVNGAFVDIGGAAKVDDGGGAGGNGKYASSITTLSD